MSEVSDLADPVAAPVPAGITIEGIEDSKKRTAEDAIGLWNQRTAEEDVIRQRQARRRVFCDQLGINLDTAVAGFGPQLAAAAAHTDDPILREFAGQKANGLTLDELLLRMGAEGKPPPDKKTRDDILRQVFAIQSRGLIREATFRREDKTVYVAVQPG